MKTWALAFRQDPDLKTVEHFYQECKQQGLEFPPAESDAFIKTAVSATVSEIFISKILFSNIRRELSNDLYNKRDQW